jgi:hypothetical protein
MYLNRIPDALRAARAHQPTLARMGSGGSRNASAVGYHRSNYVKELG